MKWIKASERLPEKHGLYHFKTTHGLNDVVFYNKDLGFFKPKGKSKYDKDFKNKVDLIPVKYRVDTIEWLDETEEQLPLGQQREEYKQSFQNCVDEWMQVCFGAEISKDKIERNHRFLEEALELVQSLNCTQSEAHQLVDYVFNREKGEPYQECGGVMVTLAALCLANNLQMKDCGNIELKIIWTKVDKIREKQSKKPKHSPLPQVEHPIDKVDAVSDDNILIDALEKIIEMNLQTAIDKYGDANKAEGWSCVTIARNAIKNFNYQLKEDGKTVVDIDGYAINYAGDFGNPNPEAFSDEQIGRMHGYIDGFKEGAKRESTQKEDSKAIEIAKELANWSLKYPRNVIYSTSRQSQMDGELIKIEEKAKEFLKTI